MNMDWIKSISLRLTAAGPAAAFIVLFIAIAAVAIWGGEGVLVAVLFLFWLGKMMSDTFVELSENRIIENQARKYLDEGVDEEEDVPPQNAHGG